MVGEAVQTYVGAPYITYFPASGSSKITLNYPPA